MAWIRRVVSLMVLCFLGIVLLALAWPRFLGGISRLESMSVYRQLQQEQTVSVEDIETALSDLNQAIQLIPQSANLYAERADLRIRLGRKLYLDGDPEALRILFLKARQDAADGLLRGPSDPYAWFILAHSEQIVGTAPELVVTFLEMSIQTGELEGDLLVPRSTLCFSYWGSLSIEIKRLCHGQIKFAFDNYRHVESLARFAAGLPPQSRDRFIEIVQASHIEKSSRVASFPSRIRAFEQEQNDF